MIGLLGSSWSVWLKSSSGIPTSRLREPPEATRRSLAVEERTTRLEKQMRIGPRPDPPKKMRGWTDAEVPEGWVDPINRENETYGDKWRARDKTQKMLLEDCGPEVAAYFNIPGPLVTCPRFEPGLKWPEQDPPSDKPNPPINLNFLKEHGAG